MSAATVTRGSRLFVLASVGWFVSWQLAALFGANRRLTVVLGLYGFIFHMVFGKAYALVPSYFDRELAFPRAPFAHLPLAITGTAGLMVEASGIAPEPIGASLVRTASLSAWGFGCLVLVGALGWSISDNLTGRETGTSQAKADYLGIDRFANAFVPVAFGYLLVGSLLPVVDGLGVVTSVSISGPQITHVLAVGTATLLVFALGFRLLPRFLAVLPRRWLVAAVLPASAAGPVLLVIGFGGGSLFRLGAVVQTLALAGFAVAYLDMFRRSDRRRLGLYAVLCAAGAAIAVAFLGTYMAIAGISSELATAHVRLGLLGFLGVTIVGVSYQFYPPNVARIPGVDDRTAALAVGLLVVGVGIEAVSLVGDIDLLTAVGRLLALFGACLHGAILIAVLRSRS